MMILRNMVFNKSSFENLRKNIIFNILHLFPQSHSRSLSASLYVPKGSILHTKLLQALLVPGFQDFANRKHKQEVRGCEVNLSLYHQRYSSPLNPLPHCDGDSVQSHSPTSRQQSSPGCDITIQAWVPTIPYGSLQPCPTPYIDPISFPSELLLLKHLFPAKK